MPDKYKPDGRKPDKRKEEQAVLVTLLIVP
jgi:hypothetical protein